MGTVFINYRGMDSRSYAALLYTALSHEFGDDLVFLDSECIPAGADFGACLLDAVRTARALLTVIGPRWLARDGDGDRLIDDPDDWIRRELVEAFAAGVPVIPVLTDEAALPGPGELPAELAALCRSQYRRLRHRDARSDVTRIVADLSAADPELAAIAERHRRAVAASRQPPVRRWLAALDPYRRRARTGPVMLTVLPAMLLVAVALPAATAEQCTALVLTGGLPILADQLGRARGRLLEERLFRMWGGKPTTQLLRWSGPTGRVRQELQHAALQSMLGPPTRLPTPDEESADPVGSDEVYDTAVAVLRASERTRGTLVFEENCNYGFRRNMLGLRPFGLLCAVLALAGGAILWRAGWTSYPAALLVGGVTDLVLLWFWAVVVTPSWVEQAAWAYAERLLEVVLRAGLAPGEHRTGIGPGAGGAGDRREAGSG